MSARLDIPTVLVIEDDPHVRLGCLQALQLAGLSAAGVNSAEAAREQIEAGQVGVVVTDMRLPRSDGLSVIRQTRELHPDLPVIMITGHGDVSLAVEAMRSGAYDFIPKPFSPEAFVEVVRRAAEKCELRREVSALRAALADREKVGGKLLGRSVPMARVRSLIAEVGASPVDVLIQGETGTGKELVAQSLHEASSRRGGAFVALNCGAVPDNLLDSELFGHEAGAFTGAQRRRIGKIEHAHGGTLFLDEVESMPMSMQIKLLRVLQERVIERLGSNDPVPVDVRVVAATKDNLLQRARAGSFRADLYYRLRVVSIELPPLRDRREDIPMLLENFMLMAASRYGRVQPTVSREQMRRLVEYDWPGNVRELRNTADCLVLGVPAAPFEQPCSAGDAGLEDASLVESVESFERGLIAAELGRQAGSVSQSARALKIAKTTLNDKIRKYGL